MPERKIKCTNCKKTLPIHEFFYMGQSQSICKDCRILQLEEENLQLGDKCLGYIRINRQIIRDLHEALADKSRRNG